MEISKAIAEGVIRNSRHESKFTRQRCVSWRVQHCITALCTVLAVCLVSGPALGQNRQWAKQAGRVGVDSAVIAVDSSGNSYVTGSFAFGLTTGTATFGPGEPNETVLTCAGFSVLWRSTIRAGRCNGPRKLEERVLTKHWYCPGYSRKELRGRRLQ